MWSRKVLRNLRRFDIDGMHGLCGWRCFYRWLVIMLDFRMSSRDVPPSLITECVRDLRCGHLPAGEQCVDMYELPRWSIPAIHW